MMGVRAFAMVLLLVPAMALAETKSSFRLLECQSTVTGVSFKLGWENPNSQTRGLTSAQNTARFFLWNNDKVAIPNCGWEDNNRFQDAVKRAGAVYLGKEVMNKDQGVCTFTATWAKLGLSSESRHNARLAATWGFSHSWGDKNKQVLVTIEPALGTKNSLLQRPRRSVATGAQLPRAAGGGGRRTLRQQQGSVRR